MQIEAHEDLTEIYEAQGEGVYTFAITLAEPGSALFTVNGEEIGVQLAVSGGSGDGLRGGFSVFMLVGDLFKHKGTACELTGYRIGTEF